MGFIQEFKEFAVKGNVMDLAVGVIIGGAFGKIIDSAVNDLIMPIVSRVIGSPDFTNLYMALKGNVPAGMALEEAKAVEDAVILAYGNFITVLINFILLAVVVFLLVKFINNLRRKEEAAEAPAPEPAGPTQEELLAEIRDLLKKQ